MSAFDEWFRLLRGERSKSFDAKRTDAELRDMVAVGKQAEAELAHRVMWDQMQSAAKYAWNIDDKDKAIWREHAYKRSQKT